MNVLAFKQDFEGVREEFQGCHQGDNVAMALKTGEELGSVEIQHDGRNFRRMEHWAWFLE